MPTIKVRNGSIWEKIITGGPPGEPGIGGKTAYEYAKEGGYAGTEDDFRQLLAGSAVNVNIDTTLTQSGKAADAKAVGDKITQKLDGIIELLIQVRDALRNNNIDMAINLLDSFILGENGGELA